MNSSLREKRKKLPHRISPSLHKGQFQTNLGLKDIESDPDKILEKLDAAIKALDTASDKLEERYQSYTGEK